MTRNNIPHQSATMDGSLRHFAGFYRRSLSRTRVANERAREVSGNPKEQGPHDSARERSEASHANGPPSRTLRRGLAVALRADAEASRRSGSRESVLGSPRGEAPRSEFRED